MATSRVRDSQRAKVYRADRAMWPHPANEHFADEIALRSFVARVQTSNFWRQRARRSHSIIRIKVRDEGRRGNARWSTNTISMPRWTWHTQYVLHELAHLAVGYSLDEAIHGPAFVLMLHDLTAEFMGEDAALSYRTECFRHRVVGCPTQATFRLPDPVHEFPLAAGPVLATAGYEASYRRYRQGQRDSAPKLRKGMTAQQAKAIRVLVDAELL